MRFSIKQSLSCSILLLALANLSQAEVIASATNPSNGLTYYLLSSDAWSASQAEAVALGGNLVTINDVVEDQWIFDNFTYLDGAYRDLWIGINDVDTEGSMVWVSGEPVTYTNWQSGQPSNSGGVQDYGIMWAGPIGAHISGWVPGKWDDFKSPENLGSSYTLRSGGVRTVHGLVEAFALTVEVDIKPGSDPNCFNVNGHGVIPVAVLGSDSFDVANIDQSTLSFGGLDVRIRGKKGPLCGLDDTNVDGFYDLVCHFEDNSDYWEPGNDEATLTGDLLDGTKIEGTDSICIVP